MTIYNVKVIADSISAEGKRITTLQLSYPRYVHAELMTHRAFSRNASSSRAIPVAKLADMALDNMVEPIFWGLNQPGMQASEQTLQGEALEKAKAVWRRMAEVCAAGAVELAQLGLHKQWANRPLEWFSNISVICTATEWENFFELRDHEDAQPEIRHLAVLMKEAMDASTPRFLKEGEWHLPYVADEDIEWLKEHCVAEGGDWLELAKKVSAARCCRVSYLKHDGTRASLEEELALCDRLAAARPIHASPFEHQARPDVFRDEGDLDDGWQELSLHGNFVGWVQYRKLLELSFK